MKKFLLAPVAALTAMATGALAGGLSPTIDVVTVVDDGPASSISPLLILGLIVLIGIAISTNNDSQPRG